ncbi:zinc finger protein RFP [Pogona vitticeps]
MADEGTLKTFQVQVTCTLCMGYFDAPKVLDCGHTFCHNCISKYWTEFLSTSNCPECKETVQSGNLLPNRGLESLVELVKRLEADLVSEKERVCEEHWRPLTSFCKGDRTPLCTLCVESGEHQNHDMVPLEQAVEELKEYFLACIDTVRSRTESVLFHKTDLESEGEVLLKSAQIAKEQMVAKFHDLHKFLLLREHFLTSKIESTEQEIIRTRDKHMEDIFRQISFHQKVVHDLQEKRYQPPTELVQDIGSMIGRYEHTNVAPCPEPFSSKERWQLWDLLDVNTFLDCAIKQFKTILENQLSLQEAKVTLDPQTAHSQLLLSENFRSVRLRDDPQEMPQRPARFDASLSVLGREGFGTGRNYWDVVVGSEGNWAVGVARKSVKKKDQLAKQQSGAQVYALGKLDGHVHFFCPPGDSYVNYSGELGRVRISLNCLGRNVAFFDGDTGGLIHQAVIPAACKGILFPFFQVSKKAVLTLVP